MSDVDSCILPQSYILLIFFAAGEEQCQANRFRWWLEQLSQGEDVTTQLCDNVWQWPFLFEQS